MSSHTRSGILAIVLWSSLAALASFTSALPPFQVLGISFGIAALAGLVWLGTGAGGGFAALKQPWRSFALSFAALFGYHALYLLAFRLAPPVEANLINYLWPALIVVFASLLSPAPVRGAQWLGLALGLAGVTLLVTRGEGLTLRAQFLPGYAAALCAAVVWALYSVLNRRNALVPSSALIAACAAVSVAAAVVHLQFETTRWPDAGQWLALALMGLGPTGAAFLLWDRGTKHGDIALLGVASYAAPVLSTLSLLVMGVSGPHWSQGAAVLLVLAGVALSRPARGGAA